MRVRVGRRRKSNHGLPAGVRLIGGSLFWQPTSKEEREERKRLKLPASVPLGKANMIRGRAEMTKAQRLKWAELTGLAEVAEEGTVGELLTMFAAGPIKVRPNGKARAETTVKQYRWALTALRAKFGAARYGKTEFDASRGRAIGPAPIQAFITESGSLGRRYLAVLDGAFDNGIRKGKTVYNPCDKVIPPAGNPRTREPLEWEMECLISMAYALERPVVALILRYKEISGYRISEVLRVHRRDQHGGGIRHTVKGGKTDTLEWSPGVREIVAEAEQLPHATKFPASPLFPHSRGKAYKYGGWYAAFHDLLLFTNKALDAIVDAEDLSTVYPGLAIEDLHVHDVRSKVHDDAEAMGREGHEQLGNTERVADKHYARREKRRVPLR